MLYILPLKEADFTEGSLITKTKDWKSKKAKKYSGKYKDKNIKGKKN